MCISVCVCIDLGCGICLVCTNTCVVQGVASFKRWLIKTGAPKAVILKASTMQCVCVCVCVWRGVKSRMQCI